MTMPKLEDVFSMQKRPTADPTVGELSHAVGAIERGINEAKFIVENLEGVDHEEWFRRFDDLADHAYEIWRSMMYDEPVVRWRREGR